MHIDDYGFIEQMLLLKDTKALKLYKNGLFLWNYQNKNQILI